MINRCKIPPSSKGSNYFGSETFEYTLDGKNYFVIPQNFYHYPSPNLAEKATHTYVSVTSKGGFYVYGNKFRQDFSGANLTCKVDNQILKAKAINTNTLFCEISHEFKYSAHKDKYAVYISLNGRNYLPDNSVVNNHFVSFYGIKNFGPSSGPVKGDSKVKIII